MKLVYKYFNGGVQPVVRGQPWDSAAPTIRSAFRFTYPPDTHFYSYLGFRLCEGRT